MEGLAEKLNEILSSPEGQEQLKSIAAMLGGGDNGQSAPDLSGLFGGAPQESPPQESAGNDGMPQLDMATLMSIQNMVKSMNVNDKNTQLLLALKPQLGERRRQRVDNAVKMLKLLALLPMLKQSGILSGLI